MQTIYLLLLFFFNLKYQDFRDIIQKLNTYSSTDGNIKKNQQNQILYFHVKYRNLFGLDAVNDPFYYPQR